MKTLRKLALAGITAALGTLGMASHATTVTQASNSFGFSWDYLTSSATHLTGTGTMTIAGWGTNTLAVTVTLVNTSLIGGQGGERLTSFGFGIDPNATYVSFSDTADGGLVTAALGAQGSMGSNVQGVELCAWSGSNCNGGGNGGIYGAGGTDTFTLLLSGDGAWGTSVEIDPIGFKYQTGYGSFEFPSSGSSSTSSSSGTTSGSTGSVPEPASTALVGMGLGLLGLGFSRRRQLQAAKA